MPLEKESGARRPAPAASVRSAFERFRSGESVAPGLVERTIARARRRSPASIRGWRSTATTWPSTNVLPITTSRSRQARRIGSCLSSEGPAAATSAGLPANAPCSRPKSADSAMRQRVRGEVDQAQAGQREGE